MKRKKLGWNRFKEKTLSQKKLTDRVKKVETAVNEHAHEFIVDRLEHARLAAREVVVWLVVVGALIGLLVLHLFFGYRGFTNTAPASGGIYAEGTLGAINTLNPLFASSSIETSFADLVFSSLYKYDKSGSLKKDLVEDLNISDDHKTYVVVLKSDVYWHDGEKLTAEDVLYTIGLIKNPAVGSPLRVNWLDVSVKAVGDRQIVFTLPAPYASFPHALNFPILPKHLLSTIQPSSIRESTFSLAPIGSGPFAFRYLQEADGIKTHRVIHMVVNDKYYGKRPKLDRFELHSYESEESLVSAINAGEVNGAIDVSPSSLKEIENNKSYTLHTVPLSSGAYLFLNMRSPILSDVKVRKALQLATDTKEIRNAVGGDTRQLDGPLISGQVSVDIEKAEDYNLAKAVEILEQNGWVVGEGGVRSKDGNLLEVNLATTQNQKFVDALAKIKSQWKKIGVKVNENVVDVTKSASVFIQNVIRERNYDVLLYEIVIGSDPDVYGYWHSSQANSSGYNLSNYDNKVADANLLSARARLEPALRDAKYHQFIKQWHEDVPAIALYQPVINYVLNKNSRAMDEDSIAITSSDRYADIQYWSVLSRSVYKTP